MNTATDNIICIYGPSGSGKSLNSEPLRQLFKCKTVYDELMPGLPNLEDYPVLIFTTKEPQEILQIINPVGMLHIDIAKMLLENPNVPY